MRVLRSTFVALCQGDVAGLAVIHLSDHTRVVVHDCDADAPLVQMVLSELERTALIHALQEGLPRATAQRRPMRQPRHRREDPR